MSSYEHLEERWSPLLRKFAAWRIPGMGQDDIMQEMRVVLFNAQRNYDPGKNVKFITFLYTSCLNTALKLLYKAGGGARPRKATVPHALIDSLCDGEHGNGVACSWCAAQRGMSVVDDLSVVDLLSNASQEAQALAGLIINGNTSRRAWAGFGMTRGQIASGTRELKALLKGER